jgi:hypothetical protein
MVWINISWVHEQLDLARAGKPQVFDSLEVKVHGTRPTAVGRRPELQIGRVRASAPAMAGDTT